MTNGQRVLRLAVKYLLDIISIFKATATSRDKMFEHDLKDYNDGQDYHWPI